MAASALPRRDSGMPAAFPRRAVGHRTPSCLQRQCLALGTRQICRRRVPSAATLGWFHLGCPLRRPQGGGCTSGREVAAAPRAATPEQGRDADQPIVCSALVS